MTGATPTQPNMADDAEPLLLRAKSKRKKLRCWWPRCCVATRGALAVVFWSMLVHGFNFYYALQLILLSNDYKVLKFINVASAIIQALSLLFYPFAGLLAETCCRRFNVMIGGNILMIAGIVFYSPFLYILNIIFDDEHNIGLIVGFVIFLFLSLMTYHFGLGTFEANVIQFGTDQLQFSSSVELSKFVHWYYWSAIVFSYLFNLASVLGNPSDIQLEYEPYVHLALLLVVLVFVGICWYHRVFIIEPVSRKNPLTLIIAVMKFASRHKAPVLRSAFTYGETSSRLDHAKQRYGGPFTTEEVEDVKSFWKILLVLLPLFGYALINEQFVPSLLYSTLPGMDDLRSNTRNLNSYFALYYLLGHPQSGTVIQILVIPVYELLIRSRTRWRISMLKRMGVGMIASLLTIICVIVMKYLVIQENKGREYGNCTDVFFELYNLTAPGQIPTALYLAPISLLLTGISHLLVFMTALEFILAQAPRSMQGLLIGLWYAYQTIGIIVGVASGLILTLAGCFYWVDIGKAVVCLVSFTIYMAATRKYKNRTREEQTDVNQQSIVEEYTERQLCRRMNYMANESIDRGPKLQITD